MAYTLTTWENGVTPINAGNLNKMEQGIKAAHEDVREVSVGGTGKDTHTLNSVLTGNGTDPVNNVATANGAFYATAENEAPVFGPLPIGQGGTGKKNAADALAALGGISEKLLWPNASPTSAFEAQIMNLDSSEYDVVKIIYRGWAENEYAIFEVEVAKNSKGRLAAPLDYNWHRDVAVTDNTIIFATAKAHKAYGNTATVDNNLACIPLAIYAKKGVQ